MKKSILYVGGAAAAILLFMGGKLAYNATRLQFYIAKIGLRMSGLTPYVDVDLMIQNPAASDYELTAFVGQLYFNGSLMGNASIFTPVPVKAYNETKVVIPVKLSLLGSAQTLIALLQNGGTSNGATLRVTGTVTVNSIPVPLDVTQNII